MATPIKVRLTVPMRAGAIRRLGDLLQQAMEGQKDNASLFLNLYIGDPLQVQICNTNGKPLLKKKRILH